MAGAPLPHTKACGLLKQPYKQKLSRHGVPRSLPLRFRPDGQPLGECHGDLFPVNPIPGCKSPPIFEQLQSFSTLRLMPWHTRGTVLLASDIAK
jgi:hypothetical protein